ncbi:DUF3667 domain-containing protein [Pedobacter punctiformis]|uniref:DUF3667 domain-containing protein n=1 Tax=Pedobacter punctiformis TaxID=3004097 RepID=A0ABT4L6U2_9SPHI|nr:DUF3667 domain-containing protein [Pedobacter sp. HCMS5-2]MCZ4243640.1 DUF3667 domain-containing protein [Pedobacter sp. HCMS5-2]
MSVGKYRKEHNCLNCGAQVEKHYCSDCGQPNLELKENFWQFISHSIAHYFHFDNKFFQTLKPLITQPGQVTLDYLAGKRARYINPVSMYIFVSIVYFLIVPKAGGNHEKETKHEAKVEAPAKEATKILRDTVGKELEEMGLSKSIISSAVTRISHSLSIKEFKKLSFKAQDSIIKNLEAQKTASNQDSIEEILESYRGFHIIKQDSTYESYLSRQSKLSADERDNWYERLLKKRDISINQKSSNGFWSLSEEVEHYRAKQYFLLMPLLAFFIMRIFRRNHIYYLDHLIFTIHGMTAFFLLKIATVPLQQYVFGPDSYVSTGIKWLVVAAVIWYMYTGLKVFYQRTRSATIKKMILIVVLYLVAFSLSEMVIENLIYYFLA